MNAGPGLIQVLEETRAWLALADNDFVWSSWEDATEALAELDGLLERARAAPLDSRDLLTLAVLYAPTGPVQEVSLNSGWSKEYLGLAERMDRALEQAMH